MNDIPGAGPETAAHISVRELRKNYNGRPALQGLNLDLYPGRIVGLMGENGCGKTTLLKILAGTLAGYSGQALVCGQVPGPKTKALLAYLPDTPALPETLSGDGAMGLYGDFFADFDRVKAAEMLRFFGLEANLALKSMSKGMREKLQIALVMSRNARVYLLDEPISGVDPAAREVILKGIIRGFSEDALMVLSTHLITDVEQIVDEVVFMRYGQVLVHGVADELRENSGHSLDQLFKETYACLPN